MNRGVLHRNGHGVCGVCRAVEDRCSGGRRERKRSGWRYEPVELGWVCPVCSIRLEWPGDVPPRGSDNPQPEPRACGKVAPIVEKSTPDSVRGFGARRPRANLEGLKPSARKATRRARRKASRGRDRAHQGGKEGARANRPTGLHAQLEPRKRRGPIRTLRKADTNTS